MKLSKIYTRTGDLGSTSLVGGVRVSKDCERIEAYGTVDELSSHLGLLRAYINEEAKMPYESSSVFNNLAEYILHIQNILFSISTYLATDTQQTPLYSSAKFESSEIDTLEQQIDILNSTLPELDSFVLPGESIAAAQCHVCRTVCRRAERRIISLKKTLCNEDVNDYTTEFNVHILFFFNRLSDYLFVLARKLNFLSNIEEKTWKKTCR